MQLAGFDMYRYQVPLRAPLPLKAETLYVRRGLLLQLSAGGVSGLGEAAPLPGFSMETLGETRRRAFELRAILLEASSLLAGDWTDLNHALYRRLDELALPASLRYGVELAAWNLYANRERRPLPSLIAPSFRASVPLNELVGDDGGEAAFPPEDLKGYRAVKLKVGRRPLEDDIRRVRRLHEKIGPGALLRLDANRAWTLEKGLAFARQIPQHAVEYLEEPLADPGELPSFTAACALPVALDETVLDLSGAEDLRNHAYARAVVLKPTLLGGLTRTLRLARRAAALGMKTVISGSYEAGVGTLGLVALAAGLAPETPAGLTPYRRLQADVLTPPLALNSSSIDVEPTFRTSRSLRARVLEKLT